MRALTVLLAAAAALALASLLACGLNNDLGSPRASPAFPEGCWELELVSFGGWPGPVGVLWQEDPGRPECGMRLCFTTGEAGDRVTAEVACNSCAGAPFSSEDEIVVSAFACTETACGCGPPFSASSAAAPWPVLERSAERLVLGIPVITPGGSPARWVFRPAP